MVEGWSSGRALIATMLAALLFASCSGGDGQDRIELGEAVFPWELLPTWRAGSNCYQGEIADDFDGDGHLDFVLQEGSGLRVRLGRAGRFVDGPLTPLPLVVPPPNCGLFPLAAFHLGTDFDLDLVVTNYLETLVLENQGDGSFAVVGTLPIDPLTAQQKFAGIDLDGDGDADWVSVGPAKTYLRTAAGSHSVHPGPYFWAAPYTISTVAPVEIRDSDGDGVADVLYLEGRGDSPGLICYGLGGAPPTFSFPQVIGDVNVLTPSEWLHVDVDADGIIDYVDVTRPVWLRGDGGGRTVGGVQALPPGLRGMFASVGDLDGDLERNDLLVFGIYGSRGWFRQPGGGFAQGPQLQAPGVAPLAILSLVGDLDGDGTDDLVGYRDRWLFFHPNSGVGGR